MYIPYVCTTILDLVTLTLKIDLLLKTLTLVIVNEPEEVGMLYFILMRDLLCGTMSCDLITLTFIVIRV